MWNRGIFIFSLICHSLAKEVILNLNAKRPVFVTSEKFLSFTLDPTGIFSGDLKSNFLSSNLKRSINIAKAFSPAYVRFAGPKSNSFTFENKQFLQENENISDHYLTENILTVINQWAEKSNLNLITCIGQQSNENKNASQLWNTIAYSDQKGYNTSWQIGYECQSRCNFHGEKLGQEIKRLRRMLNAFPRYSTSIIVGPDVTEFKTKNQRQYLLDYFHSAGSDLSSVTWHPNFDEVSLNNNEVIVREENLSTEKKKLETAIGQTILEKPLWIAESKGEKCKTQFIGALVWARRLGNAAKVGAQVLMRQPDNSNLFKASPDFWVSLLHKKLVGPEVFNLNVQSGNETHINFFCQCTKPSLKYKKGSLTIFGINLTPNKIMAKLKGLKIKEADDYILLPGFDTSNRMFAETILLNNKILTLKNGNEIPDIEPIERKDEKGVSINLPSGGIGFWVIPNLKLKVCGFNKEKMVNKQKVEILTHLLQTEEKKDLATEELTDLSKELREFFPEEKLDLPISEDEGKINPKFEIIEKKTKRSRRNAENMNNLLNREMFLQGENNRQYRTIRKAKTSEMKEEVDPEGAIIIGPDEDIIEDGSGAHDIVEKSIPEPIQFPKVKREFKRVEKIPKELKSTERTPLTVGAKPELIKESKSSTEKMITSRDTKKSPPNSPNAKNIQNSSENSPPSSRKRVRNVFGNKLNIQNQNPMSAFKFSPPVFLNTDQLKQRVAEARVKLRSVFQDLSNPLKYLRPFPAKREILGQTQMEKFKAFQKNQEARNAQIIQNFKQNIENLKFLQNSNSVKNTINEGKIKEFVIKGEEQLNKLRNNLRVRYDEIMENYKSKSNDFFKKTNDNNKFNVRSVQNFMKPAVDSQLKNRISNIFNNLQQKQSNSLIKREIILPKLLNLIKFAKIQKLNGDESEEIISNLLNLIKLPRNLYNYEEESGDDLSATEEAEVLRTLTRFFINHLNNYPLLLLGSDDPLEIYPSARESVNILDEKADIDDAPCDELSSEEEEEDENWNYRDKYRRISRSAEVDQLNEIDENPINGEILSAEGEEKYSRKRRETENEEIDKSEETNPKISKSRKRTREKKKKKKSKVSDYDDTYTSDYSDYLDDPHPRNPNYWHYPHSFYTHPYGNHPQNPAVDEFPNRYDFHYENQNPVSYYHPVPLFRRRREIDESIIKTTTDKGTINHPKNQNDVNEKETMNHDFLIEKVENCLESSLINCPEDLISHDGIAIENSQIKNSGGIFENTVSNENFATTDNFESLMSIEKIYEKSVPPSTKHRIYSRKMMSENEDINSTFFQDVTKTIENIYTYFSNMTHSA